MVLLRPVVIGRVRRRVIAADLEVRRGGRGAEVGEDGGGGEGRKGELETSCLGEHGGKVGKVMYVLEMEEVLEDVKL